jgi:hypothetical protein
MRHLWIHGAGNLGKTTTVKMLTALGGLSESEIYRPNYEALNTCWEGFNPTVHQVIVIDEAPELHKGKWNRNKLKG